MAGPDLRPLTFGELLDRTFTLYRKHLWLFVGIMAVPQVFALAFSLSAGAMGHPGVGEAWSAFFGLVTFVMLGFWLLAYSVGYGAITFAVSDVNLGRAITIRGAYEKMRGRLWGLFKVYFHLGLRMFLCAITIVLLPVAVLMVLWYAFAVPALLVEKTGARQALKRSSTLTKGQRDRICLIGLLMGIIGWTVSLVLQGPFLVATIILTAMKHEPPYWLEVLKDLTGGVAGAFAGPLMTIALVLLYFDVRVRKEGYDLQVMVESLAGPTPARAQVGQLAPSAPLALKKTSVAVMILLGVVTLGLYVPYWLFTRRKALNALRSAEKLNLGLLLFYLIVYVCAFLVGGVSGFERAQGAAELASSLGNVGNFVGLAGGIIGIFIWFRIRAILLDHFGARQSGPLAGTLALQEGISVSGVLTFFFGIFYLQYKINEFLEFAEANPQLFSQPEQAPASGAAPS